MQIIKGKRFKIIKLSQKLKPYFRQKLLAMGLVPGAVFEVKRLAPLGDPIQITIHGFELSLRRRDLDMLELLECLE